MFYYIWLYLLRKLKNDFYKTHFFFTVVIHLELFWWKLLQEIEKCCYILKFDFIFYFLKFEKFLLPIYKNKKKIKKIQTLLKIMFYLLIPLFNFQLSNLSICHRLTIILPMRL